MTDAVTEKEDKNDEDKTTAGKDEQSKKEEEESKKEEDDVKGPLNIKIVGAELTRDTEMFGKMDPYLELFIGGELIHKTKVLDDAGKSP